jgi:hypothetical protein
VNHRREPGSAGPSSDQVESDSSTRLREIAVPRDENQFGRLESERRSEVNRVVSAKPVLFGQLSGGSDDVRGDLHLIELLESFLDRPLRLFQSPR